MSYFAAILVVALSAATAGTASWLVRQMIGPERRRQHREMGGQVFAQVGIMFSVLLSFVFSEVWGEYNIAAQAVSHECGALHGAAMLANSMSDGVGRPVNQAILAYGRTVSMVEWPAMKHRERSSQAAAAFQLALDRAARLRPADPTDLAIRNQVVALLIEAHASREVRTFQITAGLPTAIWVVLIGIALVLDGFLLLAGTELRSHIFLVAAAVGSAAAALVMVRMFDYPFEGALAMQNTDFVKMTGEVATLIAGR